MAFLVTEADRPLFRSETTHKRLCEPVEVLNLVAGVFATFIICHFQAWDGVITEVGGLHAMSNCLHSYEVGSHTECLLCTSLGLPFCVFCIFLEKNVQYEHGHEHAGSYDCYASVPTI